MNRDLLEQLAEIAREEQEPVRGDPRFEQLAQDALDDETIRALEDADASDEHRATVEASRPFDQRARNAFFERAKQGLEEADDGHADVVPAPRDNVVPLRRKRWYAGMAAVGSALAAAAVLVLLLRPAAHQPLPEYALDVAGGEQIMRSAGEQSEIVLGPGSLVRLVLRPAKPVEGPIEARTFVATADGDESIRAVALATDASEVGALRVDLPGDVLVKVFPEGAARVIVAIGRPGTLPDSPRELLQAKREGTIQIIEQTVVLHR